MPDEALPRHGVTHDALREHHHVPEPPAIITGLGLDAGAAELTLADSGAAQ